MNLREIAAIAEGIFPGPPDKHRRRIRHIVDKPVVPEILPKAGAGHGSTRDYSLADAFVILATYAMLVNVRRDIIAEILAGIWRSQPGPPERNLDPAAIVRQEPGWVGAPVVLVLDGEYYSFAGDLLSSEEAARGDWQRSRLGVDGRPRPERIWTGPAVGLFQVDLLRIAKEIVKCC